MRFSFLVPKVIHRAAALVLCFWMGVTHHELNALAGQQKILRKSDGVLIGSATKRIEPEYPARARQRGISGRVVVEVTINQQGAVISASPVSGPAELREAAVRAARRWKFSPTYLSGSAVTVVGEISFNFEFDGDAVSDSKRSSPSLGRTVSANSPMLLLSEHQRRLLNKRLEVAAPSSVKVTDQDGASVGVASVIIRSSRLGAETGPGGGSATAPRNNYAMKAEVILLNRSDQRIVCAGLEFTNTSTGQVFYVYTNGLSIGGRKHGRFHISLMLLNTEPSNLSVQAVGALFGDSSIWGAFPFPPPLRSPARGRPQTIVDSKPELLSTIRPAYTEEARRNRVRGAVRLSLEIGANGAVGRLEILNALPDGLTDEAIRIARRLSFKPATKDGAPVPCEINLDIEFRGG